MLQFCTVGGTSPASFALMQSSLLPFEHATVRDCEPPPHTAEHLPHAPTFQLGHAWVLHTCERTSTGQPVPPWAEGRVTERVDVCVRLAHVAEHVLHADQALTWQLTGHG